MSVICVWQIEGALIECSECIISVWQVEGALLECSDWVISVWQVEGALLECSVCHLCLAGRGSIN